MQMFDAIEAAQVPPNPAAVAGYVDGIWPSYNALVARFPKAHHLSITVRGGAADCCDCETGDLTVAQAEAWVAHRLEVGAWRPCVYANASTWDSGMAAALSHYGNRIRRWIAAYPGSGENVPSGYDAHQYADSYEGRNVDVSVVLNDFFALRPAPIPSEPGLSERQRTLFWRIWNHDPQLQNDNTLLTAEQRHLYDAIWNDGWAAGRH